MSIAYKCDLCGKIYDPYCIVSTTGSYNGLSLIHRIHNVDSPDDISNPITFDCCPECMQAIGEVVAYRKELNREG